MAESTHSALTTTNLHVPGYRQDSDPGAVGAGIYWVDSSGGTGAWTLKVRNAANSAWEAVASGGGAALTVQEVDGSPSDTAVTIIRVTNGKLTDNGVGDVTMDLSGGWQAKVTQSQTNIPASNYTVTTTMTAVTGSTLTVAEAGHYVVSWSVGWSVRASDNNQFFRAELHKNDVSQRQMFCTFPAAQVDFNQAGPVLLLDLAVSDVLKIKLKKDGGTGASLVYASTATIEITKVSNSS